MYENAKKLDFAIPVLVSQEGSKPQKVTCHVNALTDKGLVLISSVPFQQNQKVTIHLLRETLDFTVAESNSSPENAKEYSTHLQTEDDNVRLEHYFSSFSQFAS